MTEKKIDGAELKRVIRKIKRCLALSASSNETEAATAMRQAQLADQLATEIDLHARQWLLPDQLVRDIVARALNDLIRLPLVKLNVELAPQLSLYA